MPFQTGYHKHWSNDANLRCDIHLICLNYFGFFKAFQKKHIAVYCIDRMDVL